MHYLLVVALLSLSSCAFVAPLVSLASDGADMLHPSTTTTCLNQPHPCVYDATPQ